MSGKGVSGSAGHCLLFVTLCGVATAVWAEGRSGAPARHPPAVHEHLRNICESAGYAVKSYRQCAEAIAAQCRRAGVPPEAAACWQWLVDRDARGNLDRNTLKPGGPRDKASRDRR